MGLTGIQGDVSCLPHTGEFLAGADGKPRNAEGVFAAIFNLTKSLQKVLQALTRSRLCDSIKLEHLVLPTSGRFLMMFVA